MLGKMWLIPEEALAKFEPGKAGRPRKEKDK